MSDSFFGSRNALRRDGPIWLAVSLILRRFGGGISVSHVVVVVVVVVTASLAVVAADMQRSMLLCCK